MVKILTNKINLCVITLRINFKFKLSIASTLVVPPSDEDTEIQSSTQSSEEGNQSIASRTRLNRHANEPQPTDSDMRGVHLRLIVNTK